MKMNEVKKPATVKEAADKKVVHCSQCGKGFGAAGVKSPYHTGFSHCKDHKGMKIVAEGRTEVKDKEGKVVSWKDEGDWKKSTAKKDPRGKVTNMSDKARKETEKMSSNKNLKEAHQVTMHIEDDHEVSMAQGDLYEMAKKAIALHGMLDHVDNLEGWVQAKITMAADYVGTVFDHLDHKLAMQGNIDGLQEPIGEAIVPTGSTVSAKKLPPQTAQVAKKVAQGLNTSQNSVMTDPDGNVSIVAKKDVAKKNAQGNMEVTEEDNAPAEQYKSLNDVYPAGQTEVWYWKENFGRDAMMGANWLQKHGKMPTLASIGQDYKLIGKIKETNPEKVFMMMQGDMWSPAGQARSMIKASGTGHTSMSVGDIIKIGSKMLMVDRFGFHELGTEPQEEGYKPLRKKPMDESVMSEISAELEQIAKDEDMDALYDLMTANTPAGKYVQNLADDVSINNHLHPDDDHEEILSAVMDSLVDEFGGNMGESSFADAGEIAGGILGGAAGAALGKTPNAAIAGSALGSAAGTAAGKWVDKKLNMDEDDEHVGDDNIVYQMRKVINLRGQYEVKFADGSKSMIPVNLAHAALQKFQNIRMPDEKLKFVRTAGKNIAGLKAAVGVQEEAARRAKRVFGEDWGTSDTSAAINAMKEYIRRNEGGRYTPETIEAAAADVSEMYYDDMGYDNAADAADSLVNSFVRRWMSGSLKAD